MRTWLKDSNTRAYRSKTLLALKDTEEDGIKLLIKELALLDELVKVHLKNYQVWYDTSTSLMRIV